MGIDGTALLKPDERRGRGAVSNAASARFDALGRLRFDDGWGGLEETASPIRTTVGIDATRRIIARNTSPDIPFDQSINPYRGCEHGCVYCFARPSHAYLGLSPGADFESRLFAKPDAARLLKREISSPRYVMRPIALGTNTDPYQPVEKRMRITRGVIAVLAEAGHPFSIVTKSHLVTRDLDILAPAAARGLVRVYLSITTLNNSLARTMEPRAATPARRLEALAALAAAGVPAGVMVAPVIPGLNDHEIEWIIAAAADAGARSAAHILLRLPHEVRELFSQWLETHFPDRAAKVLHLLADMRGGKLNDPRFGHRMRGHGPYAALIARRVALACRRHGLNRPERADGNDRPQPAAVPRHQPSRQLSLF